MDRDGHGAKKGGGGGVVEVGGGLGRYLGEEGGGLGMLQHAVHTLVGKQRQIQSWCNEGVHLNRTGGLCLEHMGTLRVRTR